MVQFPTIQRLRNSRGEELEEEQRAARGLLCEHCLGVMPDVLLLAGAHFGYLGVSMGGGKWVEGNEGSVSHVSMCTQHGWVIAFLHWSYLFLSL